MFLGLFQCNRWGCNWPQADAVYNFGKASPREQGIPCCRPVKTAKHAAQPKNESARALVGTVQRTTRVAAGACARCGTKGIWTNTGK